MTHPLIDGVALGVALGVAEAVNDGVKLTVADAVPLGVADADDTHTATVAVPDAPVSGAAG